MHRRIDPSDRLLATAADQGGVIGAEQLVLLDFTLRSAERLVHQRSWVRLASGVYQVGVGEPSWQGRAWAGVLLGGPRARLGFETAGHLWKLVDEPPADITVLVPHGRPIADRGRWVFRQERSGVRSARSPGSPPRTTIEDTVVDLCTEADTRALPGLLTRAVLGGDVTLRYGWPDVTERPCAVAWEVAGLLIRRGWTGVPTRCRLCALATDADLNSA